MFSSSRCPTSKLQIYNSPQNLLFLARHLGCMQATTPYCYFQDDDWFVQPIRSLYAQFKRDPEGSIVVGTTKEMAIKYRSEWCFFRKSPTPFPSHRMRERLNFTPSWQRNLYIPASPGSELELSLLGITSPTISKLFRLSTFLETN
jgi:hypothetical protein